MSNITAKINLTKLKAVLTTRKGKSGDVEGVFIPIDANHLFKSEKGNVYLDLSAWPLKEPEEGKDTHLVKQSMPKEVYENMTDEEKKQIPIIGNMKLWSGGQSHESEATFIEGDDDLPF